MVAVAVKNVTDGEAIDVLVDVLYEVYNGNRWLRPVIVAKTRPKGAEYAKRICDAYYAKYCKYSLGFSVASDNSELRTAGGVRLLDIEYASNKGHRLDTSEIVWLAGTSSWPSGAFQAMKSEASIVMSTVDAGLILVS